MQFSAWDTEHYWNTVPSDREKDFPCNLEFVKLEFNNKKIEFENCIETIFFNFFVKFQQFMLLFFAYKIFNLQI